MPVLINWKICDNAKECNGIAICPVKAMTWDEKRKTIVVDNSKCISCGRCVDSCAVKAIHLAKTEAEYKKIKDEIEKDPRKISDLFVDRYGGTPVDEYAFSLKEDEFQGRILEATRRLAAVEVWNESSIHCLIACIPIKELISGDNVIYRKFRVTDKEFFKKYAITKLPALLFFSKGKLLGKIEGFYNTKMKQELKEKINKIIKTC